MKAAIYGSYSFGNYGDDIMAIQFAVLLQKLDFDVYVYRLNKKLADNYSIKTINSFDELLKDASFCIIGGGGVMVDNLTNPVALEFSELLEKSVKYNCSVFPISIGGQGKGSNANLSKGVHSFLNHPICRDATVRLLDDIDLFDKLGKKALYYPDVLLSVSKAWNIEHSNTKNNFIKVGISLPNSPLFKLFFAELKLISLWNKNIIFYFIPTYLSDSSFNREFLPKKESAYFKIHNYEDPQSTLKFLSSLDLLISHKLHLGVTALAVGTPFYSIGGQEKVKAFLKEIGADFAMRPSTDKIFNLAWLLSSPQRIQLFRQQYDFKKLENFKTDSWGHMDKLTSIALQIKESYQDDNKMRVSKEK